MWRTLTTLRDLSLDGGSCSESRGEGSGVLDDDMRAYLAPFCGRPLLFFNHALGCTQRPLAQ